MNEELMMINMEIVAKVGEAKSLFIEAIDLALDLSRKVIEKNIDEEKNRQLIDEFISEVGN